MIAKLSMGSGFKGVFKYLLKEDKEPEILKTEAVRSSYEVDKISSDFISIARQNRKVQKPVWHFSLSFSPDDKPRINDQLMNDVAERFLSKMNIGDRQYAIIKHNDTNHPHLHIVVNRVDFEGKVLQNKDKPKLRAMAAAQQIEEEFNLVIARQKSRGYSNRVNLEQYKFKPGRDLIDRKIKEIFNHTLDQGHETIEEFKYQLKQNNIEIVKEKTKDQEKEFENLHYSYTHYDNRAKEYVNTTATLPLSKIRKLNIDEIEKSLRKNHERNQSNQVAITLAVDQGIKNQIIDKQDSGKTILSFLLLSGFDIKKRYVVDGIARSQLAKEVKDELDVILSSEKFFISSVELKKQIFNGEFDLIEYNNHLSFSFNSIDRQLIGATNLDQFYQDYLLMNDFSTTSPVAKLLRNKHANSDTIKYIISNLSDRMVPYDEVKVDYQIAKTALILSQIEGKSGELDPQIEIKNKARKALYNFSLYNNDFYDLCIYLSRRGYQVQKVNKNAHIFKDGQDLGLAASLGYAEAKRYDPVMKNLDNKELKSIYELNFDQDNLRFYDYLDQFDIKAINNRLKTGDSFQLDTFDLRHLPDQLGKDLKKHFSISEARGKGGSKMIFNIKKSLQTTAYILSKTIQ